MFRSVLGFAVVAVLAWLGLKVVFSVLGGLIGLAMTALWLAATGFTSTHANRPSSVTAAAATVARPPRPTPAKRGVPRRTRAFATTSASGAYSVSAARSPFASNSTACRAISCTMSGVPTAAVAPLGARRRERVTQAAPSVAASSSTRRALARIERAQHRPGEERDQDLVVAGELNPATAGERRALDDVYPRPVVALHVAVAGRETGRLAAAEV